MPNVATRGGVALRTFVTESDLVELIATRALSVVFQPLWQVDAARVIGFEALARFPFGEPQEWFLAARTYGLEAELDRLAMEKALEAYAGSGGEALLFANVDIPETPWPLRAGGVDLDRLGSRVVLEVTERMMGRGRDLYSAVAELRRHGFGLAVDDMGTGASDDHRVELLAPEYLKLERTLLERMFRRGDPVAWQEARRHLALAREIGAEVLAEGVEDLAWLGELAAIGVNLAQGYALGRPAPLAHWLDGEAVDEVARALRACGVVQGGPPGVLERRRVAEWLEVSQERLATDLGRWLAVRHAEPGTVRRLLRLLMGMLRMDGRPAALASDERAELRALSADAVVVSHLLPLMRGPIRRLAEAQGLAPPEVGALVAAVDRLEMFLVRERLRQERHEGALAREEARNRSEGLGLLGEVHARLAAEPAPRRLYDWLAVAARVFLRADLAAVVEAGADGQTVVARAGAGVLAAVGERWPAGRGVSGQALASGRRCAGGPGEDPTGGGHESVLAVPVRGQAQVVAAVVALRRSGGFAEADGQLLEYLAGEASLVLELWHEVRKARAEVAVHQAVERIVEGLAGGEPPASLASAIVTAVGGFLGGAGVGLFETRPFGATLWARTAAGPDQPMWDAVARALPVEGAIPVGSGEGLVVPVPGRVGWHLAALAGEGRLPGDAETLLRRFSRLVALLPERAPSERTATVAGGAAELSARLRQLGDTAKRAVVFLHLPAREAARLLPAGVEAYDVGAGWTAGLCLGPATVVQATLVRRMRQVGTSAPVHVVVWEGETLAELLRRLPGDGQAVG